jgi:hypothetical protein
MNSAGAASAILDTGAVDAAADTIDGEGRGSPAKEAPFAWQSKRAIRKLVDPSIENRAHAILVYVGLTVIASNQKQQPCNTFQATKGHVADICGLGTRSVASALYDLERLGLILIARRKVPGKKVNDTNVYTILSIAKRSCPERTTPNAQDARGSCKGRRPSFARNKNNPAKAGVMNKNKEASPHAAASDCPAFEGGQPAAASEAGRQGTTAQATSDERANDPHAMHKGFF